MEKLPEEILNMIVHKCTTSSLKQLRTTSKRLLAAANRVLFECIYVGMTKDSIDNFVHILGHPVYKVYVKEVHFSDLVLPALQGYDDWKRRLNTYAWGKSEEDLRKAYRMYEDLRADGKDWSVRYAGEDFARCISWLPNLTKVTYEEGMSRAPSVMWRNYEKKILVDPSRLSPRWTWESAAYFDGRAMKTFFEGLRKRSHQTKGSQVTTMDISIADLRSWYMPEAAQSVDLMLEATSRIGYQIRHLNIHLQTPFIPRDQQNHHTLHRLVSRMTNIESFTLRMEHGGDTYKPRNHQVRKHPPRYDVLRLFRTHTWLHLKQLKLDIAVTAAHLLPFLTRHAPTLRYLTFERVLLLTDADKWKDILPLFSRLLQLQSFRIKRLGVYVGAVERSVEFLPWSNELEDALLGRRGHGHFDLMGWKDLHPEHRISRYYWGWGMRSEGMVCAGLEEGVGLPELGADSIIM